MTNYGPPCPDCINHLDKDQCPVCDFVFQRGDPYWIAARYREALERIARGKHVVAASIIAKQALGED